MKRKRLVLSLLAGGTIVATCSVIFFTNSFTKAKGDGGSPVTNVLNYDNRPIPTTSTNWHDDVEHTISNYATFKYDRIKYGTGHCVMGAGSYITKTNVAKSINSIVVTYPSTKTKILVQTKDKEDDNWGFAYALASDEEFKTADDTPLGNYVRFYAPVEMDITSISITFGCTEATEDKDKYWFINKEDDQYHWRTRKFASENVPEVLNKIHQTIDINALDLDSSLGNWEGVTQGENYISLKRGNGNIIVCPFYCPSNMAILPTFYLKINPDDTSRASGILNSNDEATEWTHQTISLDGVPYQFSNTLGTQAFSQCSPKNVNSSKPLYVEKGYHCFVIQDYEDNSIGLQLQKISILTIKIDLTQAPILGTYSSAGSGFVQLKPDNALSSYSYFNSNAQYLADMSYLGAEKIKTNSYIENTSSSGSPCVATMRTGTEILLPFNVGNEFSKVEIQFRYIAKVMAPSTNKVSDFLSLNLVELDEQGKIIASSVTDLSSIFLNTKIPSSNWSPTKGTPAVCSSTTYSLTDSLVTDKTYALQISFIDNEATTDCFFNICYTAIKLSN